MHYQKILLKLSGEVLAGDFQTSISKKWLWHYAEEIIQAKKKGVQIAIVVGGGNIYRSTGSDAMVTDRIAGDHIGMLATMINSIALYDVLKEKGASVRLMTQIGMQNSYEPYNRNKALAYLAKGCIVIIGGGLGKPFFTTDSAASLCALELGVDILLKGTHVDGVYSADPKKDNMAQRYTHITIKEALEKKLRIMDMTALTLCQEAGLPIIVYNATHTNKLVQVLKNPALGTFVQA